ncbi:MAG: DUF3291 domain-containing protein [Psychroflexus sp.]|nr:DUF3291 domain-containing protein [Psychroflexus sp.]
MKQITTLCLIDYKGFANQFWALKMMQMAKPYLKNVEGLGFYKLLGSGKDGFKPQPDWSTYALLQVWDEEQFAKNFFESSELIKKYKSHSENFCQLYLKSIKAHGFWSKRQPFVKHENLDKNPLGVAIITRASIKTSQLRRFWQYVPAAQAPIAKAEGLVYTKGFGEFPIWEMATFSLWKNMDAAMSYAYNSKEHQKAITMTRQFDWYKEELFSRFQVYKIEGQWHGQELFDG